MERFLSRQKFDFNNRSKTLFRLNLNRVFFQNYCFQFLRF